MRPGLPSDVPTAAGVLAGAFADYPWTDFTVAADRRAERLRALYAAVLAELVVPHGSLWVAHDATGRMVGAAGWLRPASAPPADLLLELDVRVRDLRGDRADAAAAAEAAVDRAAPSEPAWHLGTLGVLVHAQGSGVGSRLLAAGLALADRDRAPARLETSSRRNVELYRRHGFEVVAEVTLQGGPTSWVMRRPPSHER